jgi:HD superfamily phosphohydrolase
MEIRDPIHGPIVLSEGEVAVLRCRAFQRLRHIKQLGFAELVFPGATHNRMLHSLGVLHLAGQAFDAVFRDAAWLPADARARLRQTLRLAGMLHDVGHAPLSHSSESIFPALEALSLAGVEAGDRARQARHEHFTVELLLHSELGPIVDAALAPHGGNARHVAALLHDGVQLADAPFHVAGRDLRSVLGALCSGEVDVDRMDYLLRDSYFAGVSYGRFDHDWLISHLTHHQDDAGRVHLALRDRALYTFDDFLLSRMHMFLMVYFHAKVVCFDQMLRCFYEELDGFRLPATAEDFLALDDAAIWALLRQHAGRSRWAERIVRGAPLRLLAERGWHGRADDLDAFEAALAGEQIDFFRVTSTGALSKYRRRGEGNGQIYVIVQPQVGAPSVVPLGEATRLFDRFADTTRMERTYVAPEHADRAAQVLLGLRRPAAAATPGGA